MYKIQVKYEVNKKDDYTDILNIKEITPEYIILNIKNREEKEEVLYNMGYKDLLVQVYKFIDNEDRREIKYKVTNNTYML